MKSFKPRFALLIGMLVLLSPAVWAQNPTVAEVKLVMEVGNAAELANYFSDKVDLNIEGSEGAYSRSQAEGVLKSYFREHPPASFQINHEGSSENGLIYAIGEYVSGGVSYRVWIRLKNVNDQFKIHEMSFVKE